MSASEFLLELKRLGVRLWLDGPNLRYDAPVGVLNEARRQALRRHKSDVVALLRKSPVASDAAHAPIARVPRRGPLPLSFAQRRVWFMHQLMPESNAYNIPIPLSLDGPLDEAALRRSLDELVRRHESLRTTFVQEVGEPSQLVHPPQPLPVRFVDLSDADARDREAQRLVAEEGARPFDLGTGPVIRALLIRFEKQKHLLLLTVHHIAYDIWSLAILLRDLSELYAAIEEGRQTELPNLPVQYADFAVWQREQLTDVALADDLAYWRERLANLPRTELPTDRPSTPVRSCRGASESIALDEALSGDVRTLAAANRVTLFTVLFAAFQQLISRYSGESDVVVGVPTANRSHAEVENLVGFLTNSLAIRTDLSGNPAFEDLLRRVRDGLTGAFAHENVPFERLVQEFGGASDFGRNPLFQVMFTVHAGDIGPRRTGNLDIALVGTGTSVTRFDLEMYAFDDGARIWFSTVYGTDLFEAATIHRMLGHYRHLLAQAVADPRRRIDEMALLSEEERRQQLEEWNATHTEYERGQTVSSLVARAALEHPQALALSQGDRGLSYAELEARANRLAHRLRREGVGADVPVAVLMRRSPAMVVAWLGAMRAGGAYLPLDPDYPDSRLAYMLADSGAPVLLTEEALRVRAEGFEGRVVSLDEDAGWWAAEPVEAPPLRVEPGSLAYLIYTSGSTGEPKAVAIEHRGLSNLVHWHVRAHAVTRHDRATQVAALGFDASVWEVWPYLCAGASVHLVGEEERQSPQRLWAWMAERGITLAFLPTPLAEAALRLERPSGLALRTLLTGGDRLHGGEFGELPFALVNHYGPTENTVVSTWGVVDPTDPTPPIGRPIDNTSAYVLDARMRPVPIGVPGELYVGGESLARGYWRRPELSAESFVPNPFGGEGERLYRTGDRVRYRPDGTIEFLGRIDQQVKLRGFRIEPGEIEALLQQHAAVREAVVLAREDSAGDTRLVAYVVAESAPAELREQLRAALRERLPAYMVPSAFVMLDTLPMTPNGKVDRGALPAPVGEYAPVHDYVAPRTSTEQTVAGIWAEVLRLERVGAHDNFFELGGHSLRAMRLVGRMRELLGVELPLAAVFEHPTAAGQARYVDERRALQSVDGSVPITAVSREKPLPMSFAQQRLWFLDQLTPASAAYNVCGVLRLRGRLDGEALERSLQTIVERHETLRTTFHGTPDSEPVQIIHAPYRLRVDALDLEALSSRRRHEAVNAAVTREAMRPFALDRDPMLRANLIALGKNEYLLVLVLHHIAADAWSLEVFLEELTALYQADVRGQPHRLTPLHVQYADFAVWQRERLRGRVLDEQLGYWRRQLTGVSPLAMPLRGVRPEVQTFDGAARQTRLSADTGERLRALCASTDATPFMVLVAIFALLMSRYSNQEDVILGSPVANRRWREVEGLIGFFLNTLPLRFDLSGTPTVRELIARARAVALGAYEHQDIPFEMLVEALDLPRDLSRNPLVQVLFTQREDFGSASKIEGLELGRWDYAPTTTRFDLEAHVMTGSAGIDITLIYNTALFDESTAARMLDHFERLLTSALERPDGGVWDLPLMGREERVRVLEAWVGGRREYSPDEPVHRLFEAQAARTPDAEAVSIGTQRLSYAELNAHANALARQLRDRGIGPGDVVGLCARRSLEMAVAVLGIIKSGAAYAALDPEYPLERLRFMVEDARMPALLAQPDLRDRVPVAKARLIDLVLEAAPGAGHPADNLSGGSVASDPAYVIYTSGSTGVPKGVVMPHRVLCNLVRWQLERSVAGRSARTLQFASLSFDVSFQEMFSTWCGGGTLVLVPDEVRRDAMELLRLVDSMKVERLFLPFTALQQLAQAGAESGSAPRSLKEIITAGEQLHVTPSIIEWIRALDDCVLDNQYGPSETHVVTAHMLRGDPRAWPTMVPIGRPISNARVYIVDRRLQPVPPGVAGELCIGGVCVADGYLGREQLTRERFVPDPFGSEPNARIYRSGDLARHAADGCILFLGRMDDQVKVRGFRVELGELEAILMGFPGVREAAAAVQRRRGDEARLVAYTVAEPGRPLNVAQLRAFVRSRVPAFMVPSAYVSIERLPLTPSGKVDRRSLPAPAAMRQVDAEFHAPQSATERTLAAIWVDVLGIERVGVDDDFFDLGGHSILATRVINRVRAAFEVDVPLMHLFELPTVAALAARIDALKRITVRADREPAEDREKLVL